MSNGDVWFWGGYFYEGYNKLLIANFNLLQEEEGLKDKKIIEFGMGFAHDTVLCEDAASEIEI